LRISGGVAKSVYFERTDDEDLYALLYLREAPIASMIMISIDLPGE
jgi:hypothetical protein